MSEGPCHTVKIKVLGRDPGDVARILAMIAEALESLGPEAVARGSSWVIASFEGGLVAAQVEARAASPGSGFRVECTLRASGSPSLIAELAERVNTLARRLGYPVLLKLEHDRVEGPPSLL